MQTAHAIGGLGELLHHQGAVFELGLASVDSPDAPPMSPEQLCRAAMALDLTRPEECEKAELTLRHACLMQVLPLPLALALPLALPLTLSGAHPAPRLPGAVHGGATLRGPKDRGRAGEGEGCG